MCYVYKLLFLIFRGFLYLQFISILLICSISSNGMSQQYAKPNSIKLLISGFIHIHKYSKVPSLKASILPWMTLNFFIHCKMYTSNKAQYPVLIKCHFYFYIVRIQTTQYMPSQDSTTFCRSTITEKHFNHNICQFLHVHKL